MNFGLAFAAQKIPGVSFDLTAINNNHEPESAEAALKVYSKLIMPERNMEATIQRLTPLINDPAIQQKINRVADSSIDRDDISTKKSDEMAADDLGNAENSNNIREDKMAKKILRKGNKGNDVAMASVAGNNTMLAQVVGIILGSPEFQRR